MVRGRKPDLERRRQVVALRARGLTLAAIGQALGVSRQCVHETLHRMGQQPPVRSVPCGGCGREIISAGAYPRDRSAALCLPCLAKRPAAPFGQRLKAFRLAAGLTVAELARRAGLGRSMLGRYESGRETPQPGSLAKLVRVLGEGLIPPAVTG